MTVIDYAAPEEREEIAQFMNAVFTRAKWDIDGWRQLVAGRWCGPEGRYAITVRDGGTLVGVLGLVYADRMTGSGLQTTANMTSWYILSEYRGQGLGHRMLEFITQDPTVTITNFTSAKAAVSILMRAGFAVLDAEQLVWHSGHEPADLRLMDGAATSDRLSREHRQIIADHSGLRVQPFGIETPDGPLLLMIYPQKKHDAYVTHEAVYASDHALFAQHAQAIAGLVLPREGAILTLDRRFAAPGIEADTVQSLTTSRYYHAGGIDPAEIDMLYSECLLLNMKF